VQITRRQFLKYVSAAAATLGMSQIEIQKALEAMAADGTTRVVWISGQACTGCTMSFANLWSVPTVGSVDYTSVPDGYDAAGLYAGYDTLADALLTIVDLDAHETLQAAAGDLAMDWLRPWSTAAEGSGGSLDATVLIVEGAIPVDGVDAWGNPLVGNDACTIGTIPAGFPGAGTEVSMRDAIVNYAQKAGVVLAVGQCATYGGIPAAFADAPDPVQNGSWSGAKGTQGACAGAGGVPGGLSFLGSGGSNAKLVNIPGCPPHPDWIVDSAGRPTQYYGETIHGPGGCPRYQDYNNGNLASRLGEKGCLAAIGCYGMSTHADCAKRGWNSSRLTLGKKIFCIEAGHPCISCTEPGYPFKINTNG
jgi:hydrogenase small subunit